MLEQPGTGARRASDGGIARHLVVALLAAAQLAIMVLGPLVDPVPSQGEHRAHISAESQADCHPYHDDHCLVCRALSADAVDTPPGPARSAPPVRAPRLAPLPIAACIAADDPGVPLARGPPHA